MEFVVIKYFMIGLVGLIILSGCIQNPVSKAPRIEFGIKETEDFTVRKKYFQSMSNRQLCEIALKIEEKTEKDQIRMIGGDFTHKMPFELADDGSIELMVWKSEGGYTNNDISLKELSNRAYNLRIDICPPLSQMTGNQALKRGIKCVSVANTIKADKLCPGLYNGETFSEALINTSIKARQLTDKKLAKDAARPVYVAPALSCSSREFFGTIRTTCY